MTLDMNRRNAQPVKVTAEKGIYREPSFSPDGSTLLFRRESGNNHQGHAHTLNPGIYVMPADGGDMNRVLRSGSNPMFNNDGSRIFYLGGPSLNREFRSVDLGGHDERTHFTSTYANKFVPSPDNKWIAFNELFKVYIAPMPLTGTEIDLNKDTKAIPVTHVAQDAGISLHWSSDSQKLHWTLGDEYFSVALEEAFEFIGDEKSEELPLGENEGVKIGLELETDKPSGAIAITNAQIITMNGDEVIENGTIIVRENRIVEVLVVPEGGSTFTHNMGMILDGHTGIEHNVPIYPLYEDVLTLWENTNVGYTPTLVVNYGSMNGEYYWYQYTNVWEKERLLTFTPRSVVDARSRHRTMGPEEEYEIGHFQSAAAARELHDRGVTVNIGAHGQLQGLAAHWETWMFTQGGMSNHDALKVATINGANYIGMADHIGSLEPGKLADLIVIDGNPLEDIYDTENVEFTMINGRLYDAATLNEIGSHPKERLPFWWERDGNYGEFDWHAISNGHVDGH